MAGRFLRPLSGGAASLTASAASYLTTVSTGAVIAALIAPWPGATFSIVGTPPGQLGLSGGSIVAGATASVAGSYSLKIRAQNSANTKAIEETLTFVAAAPAGAQPTISFSSATGTVGEAAGTVANTINVTRNGISGDLLVNLSYAGTPTSGTDYAAGPSIVTIAAGQNSVSFNLSLTNDTAVESTETIVLNAVLADYPSATASRTISVTDNDFPTISFDSISATVGEGAGTTTHTINLVRDGFVGALTVNLAYAGTAVRNTDYTAPTSVTIAAGQNSATLSIVLTDDATVESSETIVVTATLAAYSAAPAATKTVTVTDNDVSASVFSAAPTISPTSGPVGTAFTATSGTASDASNYTGQWNLDGTPVSGATGSSFTSTAVGQLTYISTATGAGGSASSTSSAVSVTAPVTYSTLAAPSGLGYTVPFTVSIGSDGSYKHNYDPSAGKPLATHTVYADWRVADNSGDGLTWATRVRSLNMAMTKANAQGTGSSKPRILAYPGEYLYTNQDANSVPDAFAGKSCSRTTLIIEACDNSGNPSNDSAKIISVHNTLLPAFVATSDASVWVSTYTTELVTKTAWDKTKLDPKGNPTAIHNVPDSLNGNVSGIISAINALNTLFGHGAFYIDTSNKKVYCRTWNGRQPDANVFWGRGTTNSNDANSRNFYLNAIYGNVTTVWARGLWTYGGCGMYGTTYMPDGSPSGVFKGWDCGTNYSSLCGIAWDGNFTSTLYRHTADYCYKDGFNYDQATGLDPSGTAVMRFHEIDCTGDWNGWDSNGDGSNNGSSCHFRAIGVRVNTSYDRTANRAINDILQARTWNVGVTASNCRQTGVQSGAFAIGYLPNTGETAQMWLDGCKSINNQYALEAYRGAALYYRNMTTTTLQDATGGTIQTY